MAVAFAGVAAPIESSAANLGNAVRSVPSVGAVNRSASRRRVLISRRCPGA